MENKYINIMKNKNKIVTLGIIATTIVLAGIAIFTAIKLYQTKNVAPTDSNAAAGPKVCKVSFTVTGPTTTPTPTAPPNIVCNSVCQQTTDCPTGLICYGAGPGPATSGRCRRQACTSKTNCICATPTATATATATSIPGIPNYCGGTCGSNFNCQANYYCYQGFCRNPVCPSDSNCDCVATPIKTTTAKPKTATPKPTSTLKGSTVPSGSGYGLSFKTTTLKASPTESGKSAFSYEPENKFFTKYALPLFAMFVLIVISTIYYALKKNKKEISHISPPINI